MSRVDQSSQRGEEFVFSGVCTKPEGGPGYPTGSVAGFNLTFTAKRKKSDAIGSAVVAKALIARTGYTVADVTLATGGAWTVRIQDTETSGFTVAELLAYEIRLHEPDGTQTVLDYGTWRVGLGVGS